MPASAKFCAACGSPANAPPATGKAQGTPPAGRSGGFGAPLTPPKSARPRTLRTRAQLQALLAIVVIVVVVGYAIASQFGGSSDSGGSSGGAGSGSSSIQTDATAQLQQYLDSNFGPGSPVGETSWYPYIQRVFVLFETANVRTTLPQGASDAQSICTAVLMSNIDGVADGKIMDAQGDTIASCP
jgi:hypothetical protein